MPGFNNKITTQKKIKKNYSIINHLLNKEKDILYIVFFYILLLRHIICVYGLELHFDFFVVDFISLLSFYFSFNNRVLLFD